MEYDSYGDGLSGEEMGEQSLFEQRLADPDIMQAATHGEAIDEGHLTRLASWYAAQDRFDLQLRQDAEGVCEDHPSWQRVVDAEYELHAYEFDMGYRADPPPEVG